MRHREEVSEQLLLAVTSLPADEQRLILAFYFEGRSQAQIAEELHVSAKSVARCGLRPCCNSQQCVSSSVGSLQCSCICYRMSRSCVRAWVRRGYASLVTLFTKRIRQPPTFWACARGPARRRQLEKSPYLGI